MQWVANYWRRHENGQYNTRRSAFWRTIHNTLIGLGITPSADRDWSSHLVWTDLYKVAPSTTGNPSSKLMKAQLEECGMILEKELISYEPKRVLFLTGKNWVDDFKGLLNKFVIHKECHDGLAEVLAEFDCGSGVRSKVVIAKHPQGKKEAKLVEEVVALFRN